MIKPEEKHNVRMIQWPCGQKDLQNSNIPGSLPFSTKYSQTGVGGSLITSNTEHAHSLDVVLHVRNINQHATCYAL